MGFINTYVVVIGSLILIAISGFLIWWLFKKIKEDKCDTVDPTGKTTYYAARGGSCDIDVNNLWWQDQHWYPWYFPTEDGRIDPTKYGPGNVQTTNLNCAYYNAGDMERICTSSPSCIGWSQQGKLSGTNRSCYFYKNDVNFNNRENESSSIPKYSCTPSPAYPSLGGIKNAYLLRQNPVIHPTKSPGLG